MSAIEISGDLKPSLGFGGASVVEDFLVRIQWFSGPVFGDFGKETMFDRIPLRGTSGIVSHGYGESEGVDQLRLELGFPGVTAATVAAAGIGENEQLVGSAIAGGTCATNERWHERQRREYRERRQSSEPHDFP